MFSVSRVIWCVRCCFLPFPRDHSRAFFLSLFSVAYLGTRIGLLGLCYLNWAEGAGWGLDSRYTYTYVVIEWVHAYTHDKGEENKRRVQFQRTVVLVFRADRQATKRKKGGVGQAGRLRSSAKLQRWPRDGSKQHRFRVSRRCGRSRIQGFVVAKLACQGKQDRTKKGIT